MWAGRVKGMADNAKPGDRRSVPRLAGASVAIVGSRSADPQSGACDRACPWSPPPSTEPMLLQYLADVGDWEVARELRQRIVDRHATLQRLGKVEKLRLHRGIAPESRQHVFQNLIVYRERGRTREGIEMCGKLLGVNGARWSVRAGKVAVATSTRDKATRNRSPSVKNWQRRRSKPFRGLDLFGQALESRTSAMVVLRRDLS